MSPVHPCNTIPVTIYPSLQFDKKIPSRSPQKGVGRSESLCSRSQSLRTSRLLSSLNISRLEVITTNIITVITTVIIILVFPDYVSSAESKVLDYKHQFPNSKVPTLSQIIFTDIIPKKITLNIISFISINISISIL